jgi:MFS family permease
MNATDQDAALAARYRDVFRVSEYRVLFTAHLLSLIGDQLSKIAISALVFEGTGSALFAAIVFGISYLPWVVIGPLLAALSDRFSRRRVMIVCDVVRALLIATLVMPGMPLPVLVAVLFTAALFAPPAQVARSALLPDILKGDAYVVAISLSVLSFQCAQVVGFTAGGLLLMILSANGILFVDALSFALSGLLVYCYVIERRPILREARTSLLRRRAATTRGKRRR